MFLKKSRFLQEPHDVTSQKTSFFIVSVVQTSNLTLYLFRHFPGKPLLPFKCWTLVVSRYKSPQIFKIIFKLVY
jgi:hypothetical protein